MHRHEGFGLLTRLETFEGGTAETLDLKKIA
jgi:hypothetical protein